MSLLRNVFVFSFYIVICFSASLPDYIPKCKEAIDEETAVELINCFIENANKSRDGMRERGIPEIGIPALNNIVIPRIEVEQVSRAYSYKIAFEDVSIAGLDKYIIVDGRAHPENNTMNGHMMFETLDLNGKYIVEGKIFDQFINQTGPMEAQLFNIVLWVQYNYSLHDRNNNRYAKLSDFSTDIEIGDVKAKVDNLFGDNQLLNKATNEFIAESAKQIVESLKPEVIDLIHNLLTTTAKVIFDKIPYYSILLKRE